MISSKKASTSAFIVAIIGLSAFFLFFRKITDSPATNASQDNPESVDNQDEIPLAVKVATVKRDDLVIKLRIPGEAVTNRKIVIKAEIQGKIRSLNVEESQHVSKGELLAELEDREYKLNLESYEADRLRYLAELLLEKQFSEAENTSARLANENIQEVVHEYERNRQLFKKGMTSEEEFENAHRDYEQALIESGTRKDEVRSAVRGLTQAEIKVKKAQMDLEKTKIIAPYSGIICNIRVSPQVHVSSASELFTLININKIQVHAQVLESEIGKTKPGQKAELRFNAYPGKVFCGRVKAVSPIIDPQNKTCRVILDVPNPNKEIKPGMHAEAEIAAEIYKNRLLIPQEAILSRGGKKLAFVVNGELAKWRYIKVGIENKDYAEILEGVKEAEKVIVEGHLTLAHDARVKIVE